MLAEQPRCLDPLPPDNEPVPVLVALTFTDGHYWTETTSEPVDALMWALKRIRTGDVVSCRVGGHAIIPMRLPSLCGAWT